MANEVLSVLLRTNLLMGAAVVLVLLARPAIIRMAGPRAAYRLWALPLLAAAAAVVPVVNLPAEAGLVGALPPSAEAAGAWVARSAGAAAQAPAWLAAVWLLGVVAGLAMFASRQVRFWSALGALRHEPALGRHCVRASNPEAGPAAVGLFPPRVVIPSDFERRFDPAERELVLAHECAHIAAGDTWIGGIVALIQAMNWFNPLIHLGAHYLRRDQEMACDANVLARFPASRRRYGEAILKTHLAPQAAPFAYAWPTGGLGDLKERIASLGRPTPTATRRIVGLTLFLAASVTTVFAARASQPLAMIWSAVAPNETLLFVEAGEGVRIDSKAPGFMCADGETCVFTVQRGVPVVMKARGSGLPTRGWTGCDGQVVADVCRVTVEDHPRLVTLR